MKNKALILIILLILAVGATGFMIYNKFMNSPAEPTEIEEEILSLAPVDASIKVNVIKNAQSNEVVLSVSDLASKYSTIDYEISYETGGVRQGVSSKPLDVAGKDTFERNVYLGTCSRNVCRPHTGVSSVSVVLVFTDTTGEKTQFSKDFEL